MTDQQSDQGVALQDFLSVLNETSASAAAFQEAVDSAVRGNYELAVNQISSAFQDQANSVRAMAQSAVNSGNSKAAQFYNSWADRLSVQASSFPNGGANSKTVYDSWVNGLESKVNAARGLFSNPLVKKMAEKAGLAGDVLEVLIGLSEGGLAGAGKELVGWGAGLLAAGLVVAVIALTPLEVPALLVGLLAAIAGSLAEGVAEGVADYFLQARNYRWRPDPLALDLDGDGIETIADNGSVLFDFDGDGVRNGTGWVGRDDGLLVLDRNGNGSIDNGGELFGADTVLANGQRATSGFQALRDLDSNSDGQFNADDAQFGAVRIWRDLNQDGASQTNELFTLDQLDIAAINLTPTSVTDVNLGGGNAIDNSGVYTRTDGSQGGAYDLLLQRNMFFRDFSNSPLPVPITDEAAALPNVQGSGAVRDLVEAASLFTRTWHATFLRTFHAMPRPANSFV